MKHIVMGISGASGGPYARRLAQCIARDGVHLHLCATMPGCAVLSEELGIDKLGVESLLERPADNATFYNPRQIGARIASGSFRTDGMVICPCSANTLGSVAAGLAGNLVTRAALVTLKEARRLVLVPRETPLGTIELENMLKLSRAGAIICPACPGFYLKPTRIEELVDFVVGRVLDLLGLEHDLSTRWDPDRHGKARAARERAE